MPVAGMADLSAGRRRRLLGCPVDLLTMQETVEMIDQAIATGRRTRHVVVNVAKLVAARRDAELREAIEAADIINADGMGIVWGARLCGIPIQERVTGIDLMAALLKLCAEKGYRAYFLGSRRELLGSAVSEIRRRHPNLKIAGYRDGYYRPQDEGMVVAEIRAARADLLFLALPSPQKERFSARKFHALNVPFTMGVGGSLDVIAGHVKRAPSWMQRAGLEWAFRLMQEPGRMWRRYLVTNSVFASLIALELYRSLAGRLSLAGGRD